MNKELIANILEHLQLPIMYVHNTVEMLSYISTNTFEMLSFISTKLYIWNAQLFYLIFINSFRSMNGTTYLTGHKLTFILTFFWRKPALKLKRDFKTLCNKRFIMFYTNFRHKKTHYFVHLINLYDKI